MIDDPNAAKPKESSGDMNVHAKLLEDLSAKPTASSTDRSGEKQTAKANPSLDADNIAKSMIQNGGFGKGEDRRKIESSIADAMLKGPDKAHELIDKVNKSLKDQGSKLEIDAKISGGGGGGGGGDGKKGPDLTTEHSEANGKFHIKNATGSEKDMSLAVSKDTVKDKDTIVGERTMVNGDHGGGGSGWGKQPPNDQLHEMTIDGLDNGKAGGNKGGGGGGGGKGGPSKPGDSN